MEEISVIKFKAFDGKVFDEKKSCLSHEAALLKNGAETKALAKKVAKYTSGVTLLHLSEWLSNPQSNLILRAAAHHMTQSFYLREEVNMKNTIRTAENFHQKHISGGDALVRLSDLSIDASLNIYNQEQKGIMKVSLANGLAAGFISIESRERAGFNEFRMLEDERGYHNVWTFNWLFLSAHDFKMLLLSRPHNAKAWVKFLDEFEISLLAKAINNSEL